MSNKYCITYSRKDIKINPSRNKNATNEIAYLKYKDGTYCPTSKRYFYTSLNLCRNICSHFLDDFGIFYTTKIYVKT